MKRRRILYALALAGLVTGLALVLWPAGPAGRTVTLSDGTRLTLRAVTAGTNTTFRFGGPFRRLAAKVPLARARRWAGATERQLWFGHDTNLALWFTSAPLAPTSGPYQFRMVDDHGTNAVRFRTSSLMRIPAGDIATCFNTPLWPRRSEFLTVQAFADVRPLPDQPEWEFRVRNPAYGAYPQWPPERFPATRTVGDTQFTLQEVPPAVNSASQPGAEARLRVTCGDQPCDDWSICGVQFRDATGNRVQTVPGDATRAGPGRWWVRVPGQLFAGEGAAKVGVGFVRRTNVPTNDTLALRGVPVRVAAASGARIPVILTNPVVGRVQVAANHVAGGGKDAWIFVASAEPLVSDISSPTARWFLVLGATDDQGRVLTVNNRELDASMSRRFAMPQSATTLDITVAAPRVVFVEWTVSRAQLSHE